MMRQIHTLRLSAPDEQLIRRGALLVEDGLRIATLPDSRRLLLIRSLNLGRIDPRRSSAAVALRLEAELAAHPPIYAATPAAAHADIVYFRDELEPYSVLIMRLLRGRPAVEWFWPHAIARWQLLPKTTAALVPLIQHVAIQQGAAAAVALLDEIHQQGALPALLDALPEEAAAPLLVAFDWQPEEAIASSPAAVTLPSWTIRPWIERWGVRHPLSFWLLATALAAQSPVRVTFPTQLLRTVSSTLRHWEERAAILSRPRDHATVPPSGTTPVRATNAAYPQESPPQSPPVASAPTLPREPQPLAWSPGAGVMLLVNILSRLGIAEALEQLPVLQECAFPQRLLQHLATRLDLPPTDPMHSVLALPEDATPPPERMAEVGAMLWSEFLQAWENAVVDWLERFAEIDLLTLIARPGYIRTTKTHVDLFFRHDQADIRIRRAGIDIDPGWTPWLGRVISFFYTVDPSTGEL